MLAAPSNARPVRRAQRRTKEGLDQTAIHRRRTAIHEAGHAVVALVADWRVSTLTAERQSGFCGTHSGIDELRLIVGNLETLPLAASLVQRRHRAAIIDAVAGAQAERLILRAAEANGCTVDYVEAECLAELVSADACERDAIVLDCELQAQAILASNRQLLSMLADALQSRGSLMALEVDSISGDCTEGICYEQWVAYQPTRARGSIFPRFEVHAALDFNPAYREQLFTQARADPWLALFREARLRGVSLDNPADRERRRRRHGRCLRA